MKVRACLPLSLVLIILSMACSGEEAKAPDATPDAGSLDVGEDGSIEADSAEPRDTLSHDAAEDDAALDSAVDIAEDVQDDPAPDAPADTGPQAWTCTPVGTAYTDGFFTLETFGGRLYAGLFGYGNETRSMLVAYPPFELTSPGLLGISESVCDMIVFEGALYANTESSGDIFRSTDGSTWDLVYDGGEGTIGCGLEVFGDTLYAINYRNSQQDHGLILRLDGGGWTTVYDSGAAPTYIREIVAYNQVLYAFAVESGEGRMLSSTNGADWTLEAVPNRYFRGHVHDGALWLGSTDFSAPASGVGVWRFDGESFAQVYASDRRYVTDIEALAGNLFAGTSNGWKDESGPCSLIMSSDGGAQWETVCTFDETAIWSMAVLGDDLYLGTWDYNRTGRLYRVALEPVEPREPVDCSPISDHSAWELCETSHDSCGGVFTDGSTCASFCAAAGLVCTARFGGEPGCNKEPDNPLLCDDDNGHASDWCECGRPL